MVKNKKVGEKTDRVNQALIENFVNLQKVMTNLAVKFDTLSDHITKLLNLFEISARSFAEKIPTTDLEKDKEFLDKLNTLLDQNKTIAKGLTLMEGKLKERLYGDSQIRPRFPVQRPRFNPEM